MDALHYAGSVRITDHAADQIDRRPHGFRLGSSGADLQETLRGLGYECRTVGQPPRCVAHSSACRSRAAPGMIMVTTTQRTHNENEENADCGSARCHGRTEPTDALNVAKPAAQPERDHDH